MKHAAILLAGGSSSRMAGSVEDKILVDIGGRPVFAHVVRVFAAAKTADALVIVARDDRQRKELARIIRKEQISLPAFFTLGGKERHASVQAGLDIVPSETEWITIHDCARPAVSVRDLQAVQTTLLHMRCGVSLAHRVTDTIRHFEDSPTERPSRSALMDRSKLWAMETPQAFPKDLIEEAHRALASDVTDDLAAVEALGHPIILVESTSPNPKLTRPADLSLLESILANQQIMEARNPSIRTGFGYDIHRLKAGLPLVLGGVRLPSDAGLEGHSDADVLSHAIADAILGACGLPDIGHYFPNTDDSIAGISSQEILRRANKEAARTGLHLVNVDATLIAEKPKVSPYIDRMKKVLAKTLQLETTDIGIKATTQERIGALGSGAGIAAHAVATVAGSRRKAPQA